LIRALSYKKDWRIRSEAASALGELNDKHAIEPLLKALQKEENNFVRIKLVEVIGKLGGWKNLEAPYFRLLEAWINVYIEYWREHLRFHDGQFSFTKDADSIRWRQFEQAARAIQYYAEELIKVERMIAVFPLASFMITVQELAGGYIANSDLDWEKARELYSFSCKKLKSITKQDYGDAPSKWIDWYSDWVSKNPQSNLELLNRLV
jgi:hypothetical protein